MMYDGWNVNVDRLFFANGPYAHGKTLQDSPLPQTTPTPPRSHSETVAVLKTPQLPLPLLFGVTTLALGFARSSRQGPGETRD